MKDYPQAKNMGLTIQPNIWNDPKVNGLQKPMLALIKTLTHNGSTNIDMMTIQLSKILATHEKDVIYNLNELHRKGFIKIYEDVLSDTGYKIKYQYETTALKAAHAQPKDFNQLFE